jgi:Sec-independent protein translocase protein TatA
VIGDIEIAIIIRAPSKIAEFARAIGRAKREYEKATKEDESN